MPGTLTVSGMSAGLPSGYKVIGPVTITGGNPIGETIDTSLVTGDNTFAVPAGAYAVAIFLGQATTVTVKVRTNLNAADGGLQIAPFGGTQWAAFPLPTGTTSLILNSSGALANIELQFI